MQSVWKAGRSNKHNESHWDSSYCCDLCSLQPLWNGFLFKKFAGKTQIYLSITGIDKRIYNVYRKKILLLLSFRVYQSPWQGVGWPKSTCNISINSEKQPFHCSPKRTIEIIFSIFIIMIIIIAISIIVIIITIILNIIIHHFLSPSGDLGIGLVWDNNRPTDFLVRLLKSSSNWTKLSMRGPQLFSGWYQMIFRLGSD